MLRMTTNIDPYPISDVCLLLRAHAEQGWLGHELVPLVRQLEQRDALPEEEHEAALAYLEVLWHEASKRAAETEAAAADLDAVDARGERALSRQARSYHTAVRDLRESVGDHVSQLLGDSSNALAHARATAPCDRVGFREWRRVSISSRTPPTQTAP
jgi:hypothetical protein